ncbi:SDR family NAD(P)-dependent oxidoreductase [Homoserinibacter sp. GY 40078]|uniref:SDR family NAD(P)-dependent oxidoreductase n=1 Tax=Homoserinibacter sp. GY 40078 TaxID=2603275 RepID=UPI0011CCDA7C|nr:SDR family NAD(P)-dependent oxidoreductase [Homoserinibacter sp. GY 40078]TXK18800.1 NAD(P)-dependent oxidoreductase [Homoserinibacter sp. GY 40078]
MIVVVAGATGEAGRELSGLLTERGDTVIALGTDEGRLTDVVAAEHRVVDLTDAAAAEALAADIVAQHGRVDALLHLVGGWKPGDTPEADAWLRPRLVTTLDSAIRAFMPALAESAGRLVLVSSTAVVPGEEPNSSYARAKAAAERLVLGSAAPVLAASGGAATVVAIRSIGEGGISAAELAATLAGVLTAPTSEVAGARLIPTPTP